MVYFTGNSLGLQPKAAEAALRTELNDWAEHGVEGHFRAQHPWVSYHERFAQGLSHLVGAKANEVVAMNALTVNLHLLLVSFYRPSGSAPKSLRGQGFPFRPIRPRQPSPLPRWRPNRDIIEVAPREGSSVIEEADIEAILRDRGDEIALVMMGGVQYFTGQWLDMPRITAAAHAAGALCGFDLAHAVGNVPWICTLGTSTSPAGAPTSTHSGPGRWPVPLCTSATLGMTPCRDSKGGGATTPNAGF